MSDQSQFVAGSIEDILLAMAEGLADAQDRLNLLDPFDAYGRPRPQYHVPYLDFDLKVYAQTRSETAVPETSRLENNQLTSTDRLASQFTSGFAQRQPALELMMARPAQSGSNSAVNEITSSISGRFVSIPPNDGMPQIRLGVSVLGGGQPGHFNIKVEAAYADSRPIENARIEFNINENDTLLENNETSLGFSSEDVFGTGEMITPASGIVETTAKFDLVPAIIQTLHIDVQLGVVTTSITLDR